MRRLLSLSAAEAAAACQVRALRLADYLIARSCRRLSEHDGDERYVEWTAELPAIIDDADLRSGWHRSFAVLLFAADQHRAVRRLAEDARYSWADACDDLFEIYVLILAILLGLLFGTSAGFVIAGVIGSFLGLLAIIGFGAGHVAAAIWIFAGIGAGLGGLVGVISCAAAWLGSLFGEAAKKSEIRRIRHAGKSRNGIS